MIVVCRLRKAFGSVPAVREVSFTAPDRVITGMLGENGAGKTTTLALICGFFGPMRARSRSAQARARRLSAGVGSARCLITRASTTGGDSGSSAGYEIRVVEAMRARNYTGGWLALMLCGIVLSSTACRGSTVPSGLSNEEFWHLIEALSEPAGTFSLSENLVSNEPYFAENARWLGPTGGVYIGVGPEQNFSYIARLRPSMAFIIDIRRENRNLHLLYKALFELSTDRADFVSRLFSRPRPADLRSAASVEEIFARYENVPPSLDRYNSNATLVRARLLTTRGLPLSPVDLDEIDRVFKTFYADGPAIHFWGSRKVDALRPSYRRLMTAVDTTGQSRSFLATEEGFMFVKDLQVRNMIVPVIGDFGGPSAIRRVGDYVRAHADLVHAFYGSNVGVYLNDQQTRTFCRNLGGLPAAPHAWFIESTGVRSLVSKLRTCSPEAK
jgi:energy-coupling factor transporter ATP-binding protein EcfA2